MKQVILDVAAYLIAGVALTAYDFAAPPIHAKPYVNAKNYNVAMAIWFTWPVVALSYARILARLKGRTGRYLLGVVLLWIGVSIVLNSIFKLVSLIVPWAWIALVVAAVITTSLTPMLAAYTMIGHGEHWRRA